MILVLSRGCLLWLPKISMHRLQTEALTHTSPRRSIIDHNMVSLIQYTNIEKVFFTFAGIFFCKPLIQLHTKLNEKFSL